MDWDDIFEGVHHEDLGKEEQDEEWKQDADEYDLVMQSYYDTEFEKIVEKMPELNNQDYDELVDDLDIFVSPIGTAVLAIFAGLVFGLGVLVGCIS